MKKSVLAFIILFLSVSLESYSQIGNPDLIEFNRSRNKRTTVGLQVLGAWSLGNIGASGVMYYNSKGSDKYFHQMNVMWNGVNTVIAVVSLLPKDRNDIGLPKTLQWQSNTEATYIAAAALDLVYSSAGLYLTEKAKNDFENRDKWNGWGNSLIYNGAFLFLFDTSMYIIHKRNGRKLMHMMEKVNISTSGLGLKIGVTL
ncbi:MAG: hypothetical protein M3R27_09980 [Bacteroidota bacterium]|nr:hypothetical protein [Bacteroidota bacterium]